MFKSKRLSSAFQRLRVGNASAETPGGDSSTTDDDPSPSPAHTPHQSPPPTTALTQQGTLCEGCLPLLTTPLPPPSPPSPLPKFRHPFTPTCPLCPLLLDVYLPGLSARVPLPPHQPLYIDALLFSLVRHLPSKTGVVVMDGHNDQVGREGVAIAVRGVSARAETEVVGGEEGGVVRGGVERFLAVCKEGDGGGPVVVNRVGGKWDAGVARGWLAGCRGGHGGCGRRRGAGLNCEMRMVDLVESGVCRLRGWEEGHECPAQGGCRGERLAMVDVSPEAVEAEDGGFGYVALSYSWGATKPAKWTGGGGDGPRGYVMGPSLGDLAPTIRDGMTVAGELGLRYYWVDQYCVDQEDPEHIKAQMRQMRRIYEKADLVVIGAAGDATYGLPGVGGRARTPQREVKAEGVTVREVASLPQGELMKCFWATRGWTFQESFLARRRLAFLNDQMYWECNTRHACEAITVTGGDGVPGYPRMESVNLFGFAAMMRLWELDNEGQRVMDERIAKATEGKPKEFSYGQEAPTAPAPLSAEMSAIMDYYSTYLACIQQYSERNLTVGADSINAFIGIIDIFQNQPEYPFHQAWGVPFPVMAQVGPEDRTRFFATALSWSHFSPHDSKQARATEWDDDADRYVFETLATRRPEFPTWTWGGWAGRADIQAATARARFGLLEHVHCSVQFRDAVDTSRVVGFDDLVEMNVAGGPGAEQPRQLVLTAKAVPPKILLKDGNTETLRIRLDLDGCHEPKRDVDWWQTKMYKGKDVKCVWLGQFNNLSVGLVLARNDKKKSKKDGPLWYRLGAFQLAVFWDWTEKMRIDKWDVETFVIE